MRTDEYGYEQVCFKLFVPHVGAKYHAHNNPLEYDFDLTRRRVSAAMSSSGIALQSFSLTNNILQVSPSDEIYRFDAEANRKLNREAPWTKEYELNHRMKQNALTRYTIIVLNTSNHVKSQLLP